MITKKVKMLVATISIFSLSLVLSACGGLSQAQIAELNSLRNEVMSLEREANSLRDERAKLEKQIEETNRKLAECQKQKDETKANLEKLPK